MIKCYGCSTKQPHRFRDCLSVTCGCSCVQELQSTPKNELIDDVTENAPKFLKIDKKEMQLLPDLTKAVTRFSKVDRQEWLPVKKDRRFKRRKR